MPIDINAFRAISVKMDGESLLVENSIRDNPQDFPLLAKYYLNAA